MLLASIQLFALVSVAPVEIGQKPGLHGDVSIALDTKKGNTDKENYAGATKVVYDSNASYVAWAQLSGEYGESNNIEDTNKLYFHARYIEAITPTTLRWEGFLQLQEDKFKRINSRRVLGGGLRYGLFDFFDKATLYGGAGGMIEYIEYTSADPFERNLRFNTYLSLVVPFNKTSTFAYSFYYQPKLDDLLDYVESHSAELELKMIENLYLSVEITYDIDTNPAIGVKEDDFTQKTKFTYKF
ncbi:MAG: DUF481 domain-containing protein [Epsilonproteobacteria bacterium]|nr:DUF481 domain-containing protein [Campylobacterota bacterium]